MGLQYENADGSLAFYYFERMSSLVEPLAPFTLNTRTASSAGDPASVVAKVTGLSSKTERRGDTLVSLLRKENPSSYAGSIARAQHEIESRMLNSLTYCSRNSYE